MNKHLLQKKYNSNIWQKIFFADVICFLLVAILSVGVCYSYFSDKKEVSGTTSTAVVSVDYRTNPTDENSSTSQIYAQLNDGSTTVISSSNLISPGDNITIKGYAVNTSNVDVYVLARLEIITNKDTEVVWFNIENNDVLYVEKGLFQVGASVLSVGSSKELSFTYTFEGERYTNEYSIQNIELTLCAHQKDYLDLAKDYNNYTAVNGYSKDSIYATHYITGRKRDVFTAEDAVVENLTLDDLEKDSGGNYLINSCKDWMIFREYNPISNIGVSFKLNCYLDFNNTTTPINISNLYNNFDGQGYTINNYNGSTALFSQLHSIIFSNFGVDGAKIQDNYNESGEYALGVLISYSNNSNVNNCFVVGASKYDNSVQQDLELTLGENVLEARIGGLIGKIENSSSISINNCYTVLDMQVNVNSTSGEVFVGGIDGAIYNSSNTIQNCYFNGDINIAKNSTSNVFAGLISGNTLSSSSIDNCFAITNSFEGVSHNSNLEIMLGNVANGSVNDNLAYINNTGLTDISAEYNSVIKVGQNQTDKNITENTFHSIGNINRCFGWDTNVWGSDIYTGLNSLPILRVFYNF